MTVDTGELAPPPVEEGLLVDGEWVGADATTAVFNPANSDEVVGTVPSVGLEDECLASLLDGHPRPGREMRERSSLSPRGSDDTPPCR